MAGCEDGAGQAEDGAGQACDAHAVRAYVIENLTIQIPCGDVQMNKSTSNDIHVISSVGPT